MTLVMLVFGMAYGGALVWWYRNAVEETAQVQRDLDAQEERLGLS